MIKPYIATTSTNATNKTIKLIIFHFISGLLSIASKAHDITNHSQIQAHIQANQIANQAQIEEYKDNSGEPIN